MLLILQKELVNNYAIGTDANLFFCDLITTISKNDIENNMLGNIKF